VRAGLRLSIAAARGMGLARMPSVAPLADVPDRQRGDGGPELVIWCKHPVLAMPMLPRRRDEIGEPVQELKRREFDDAIGPPKARRFDRVVVGRHRLVGAGVSPPWQVGRSAGQVFEETPHS